MVGGARRIVGADNDPLPSREVGEHSRPDFSSFESEFGRNLVIPIDYLCYVDGACARTELSFLGLRRDAIRISAMTVVPETRGLTKTAGTRKMSRRNIKSMLRARFFWWIKRGSGMIFDAVHRVDTGGGVSETNLQIASANRDKGIAYDPCPWSTLRRSLRLVSLPVEGLTFVDIGCGKGKVLLSAMVLPFRRIVGVEFSSYLCRVAEQNLASARFFNRKCSSITVVCADAVQYPIPEDPTIFFFANPFSYDIMELVLDNIVSSYLKSPRRIFLMFFAASSIMPQIGEFLPRTSGGRARLRVSSLLGQRSINIFELPHY